MASALMRPLRYVQCMSRILPIVTGNLSSRSFSALLPPSQNVFPKSKILQVNDYGLESEQVVKLVNNVLGRNEEGRLFAVVQLCGKQFKVTDNDIVVVEGYWPPNIGDEIRLEKVLLLGSSDFTLVGRPILPLNQASVKGVVIEKTLAHTRVWFQYLRRKQYRRIHFIKVPHTFVRITKIELLGKVNDLGDVDGTPGTGKSRLSQAVAERTGLKWIDVSDEAIKRECFDGYDSELDSKILDEDKLLDVLELLLEPGGFVVDYHGCDFFPERWFNVVFVLRTDNTLLYDRLTERGYSQNKIQNNITSEIFQTILDEARDSYDTDIVHELKSDSEEEFNANVERIVSWVHDFSKSLTSQR